MTPLFDEFSKSLDESIPRRQSLRLLGAALAGAVLSPLGWGTAWGARPDPCKSFCRCSNKTKQNQCLAACRACSGKTSRLVGSCGNYVCCSTAACGGVCSDLRSDPNCGACGNNCSAAGKSCCGTFCADLANDFDHCGSCNTPCAYPGPYEDGACVDGDCLYWCVEGAIDCGGLCTPVNSDPNNCGACGHICPADAPFCTNGTCTDGYCNGADLLFDATNCGACGHQCQPLEFCSWGLCQGIGYDYGY
jgi:hypothetical protein